MIVMITGASGGIGRATAEYFLEKGHEVYGVDLTPMPENAMIGTGVNSDNALETNTGMKNPGDGESRVKYHHYIADVTDTDSLRAALPENFSPEILINNAGVQAVFTGIGDDIDRSLEKLAASYRDIDINLKGMINATEMYAISNPDIKSVVNIGSASGHTGSEFPAYAASKGGVISYTKNAALRLAPRATCNSIDPGGVTTELNNCVMDDPALWNRIMELTPMKRWATPEEIAEWIYFLAVNNRFMTGQNLLIDGGEAGRAEFVWPE